MDSTRRFVLRLLGPAPSASHDVDWEQAVRLLRFHDLTALAVATDRGVGGGLLPGPVRSRLEAEYRATALHTQLLVEMAARAAAELRAARIPCLAFKGAALVEQGLYPDPGARAMSDADLVVPAERAEEAVSRLCAAGFVPWEPWRPERVVWLDSTAFHAPDSPAGLPLTLDLHWRTEYGKLRFGGAGPEPDTGTAEAGAWVGARGGGILWDGADRQRGLPAPEPHLVLGAEHLLKHLRTVVHLHGLADLCRLAGAVTDWDHVVRLAAPRRSGPGIGLLLDLLREAAGAAVPRAVAARLARATPSLRLARRLLEPERLLGRTQLVHGRLAGLAVRACLAGSARAAAADLVDAALPDEPWLRARYPEHRHRSVLRLRARYLADSLRWITYRGRSPASPHQTLLDPRGRE